MIIKWKRTWNNKVYTFEVNYLLSGKINYGDVKLPRIYLEDEELQNSIKSVYENAVLNKIKKNEEVKKLAETVDEKTKVRNHFRNVCFRKKYPTIQGNIKYIANYYLLNELKVLDYVSDDIEFIKKSTSLL